MYRTALSSRLVRCIFTALLFFGTLVAVPANAGASSAGGSATASSIASAAESGTLDFGLYRIQNRYSGRCLDRFTDGLGTKGNEVGMFDCTGGPSQVWSVMYSGVSSYPYLIANWKVNDGKCLTAGDIGRYWWMEEYQRWPVLQQFTTQVALSGGTFVLQYNDPYGDGDHLLDEYQSFCCRNGSPVGTFTFTNHALQRWNFIRVPWM